jgi:adenylate cyclase, class 2
MMNDTNRELEVKFYLTGHMELEERIIALGGQLKEPRVHEINLRFDTTDQALLKSGSLLRLRLDSRARVTYKGMGSIEGGARLRQELEFTVSNFDTARSLFEALGFEVYMMYEKYRTTYKLGNLEVVLDEMPYGDFAEIEGPDGQSIQAAAQQMGINWDARIMDSYTVLFEVARAKLGFVFRDLSFDNFMGLTVTPEILGVSVANQS